jgi:hypothetical protein
VILVTLGFLSVGIYGSLHIEVGFDPFDLLPKDSYMSKFVATNKAEYPESGYPANIVVKNISYTVDDFDSIDKE